ncbi:DUF6193 family natural product biosynthesis protein, partial [Streptomyces sp. NPDC048425]|uniref:DUF6193 family natural product biosynthesis protein n=1 Tax=Streptomyces sp. NPDC048425 TaxID=3365548 RepID=UPI0037230646
MVCTDFGLIAEAVIFGEASPARAWGIEQLLDVLTGVTGPQGRLPFDLPRSMAADRTRSASAKGGIVTPDPAMDSLAGLYPELGRNETLQSILQTAVDQAGYGLDVLPERAPGWWRCGARVDGDSRTTHALLGIAERAFIVSFWERGVMMAKGTTTSLDAVVSAIGAWQSGATLARLKTACPFVDYSPLAEAYERGDAVEAQWTIYRQTTAPHVDHELIEAAYAQPQLRALFPFHSHRTLNFSRCTGFPYTHDIPVITPA